MMSMKDFVYWAEREVSDPFQLIRLVRYHLSQVSHNERAEWLNRLDCMQFCLRHAKILKAFGLDLVEDR